LQARLVDGGVHAVDGEAEDVRAVGNALDFESGVAEERFDDRFGGFHSGAEALLEAVDVVQRDGGEGPGAVESAAEHAAGVIEIGEQGFRSGENRSASSVETFVHGNVDRVEQRRIVFHRARGVDALEEQAGAVEVEADTARAGPGGDPFHSLEIEALAGAAADGSFDLDGADGSRHAAQLCVGGGALAVLEGEGGASGGEGDQVESAEGLGAVAGVVEQVALRLDEHAAVVSGEQADGEVVGERSGGQPDGGFLAEKRGHAGLELFDGAAPREIVFEALRLREFREQRRVLPRREGDSVAVGEHARRFLRGRGLKRERDGEKAPALHAGIIAGVRRRGGS
jgi:hypothetical protein